jgi:hypothetical protein
MRPESEANSAYQQVMERAGFYRDGKPTAGVVEASELLADSSQTDKRIKYSAVIDADKLGATAIFELSGSPCIYFKRLASDPTPRELADLHKIAWNQGLAPLLWVVTPTQVRIYNCYSRPDNEADSQRHLIKMFENVEVDLQRLNEFAGRLQVESGEFWRKVPQIDRRKRVDTVLLEDLTEAERQLVDNDLDRTVAHALLGRSIFVAYLQDREILKPQFFRSRFQVERFVDVLATKSATYDLFEWIQDTFNGDLFPLTRKNGHAVHEQAFVKDAHLKIVREFLSGMKMKTRQQRLWPYRFDVIPVELISSIYEMFAHASDARSARERSTHYTPINLVDLVLSQVFDGMAADAKILDLSCGSGVFLVESLRRLVARRIAAGETLSRKMVRDVLYGQIYGVDINREAIQIAAFSLYLTALELDPDPQPPSALKFQPLISSNLFASDAFDEDSTFNNQAPFVTKAFTAIVGNPPWTRSRSNDKAMQYCDRHDYPVARDNPDQAFLWRIGDFANDKTRIGLLMHSKPFFSQTSKGIETKAALLTRFKTSLIINLSNLRLDGLFPTSTAPAMVLIAEGRHPDLLDSFSFITVERTAAFKRHGIIEIGPENIKQLTIRSVVTDPDMLKVASWGSARDMALIRRLRTSFPPLGELIEQNKWAAGQGFQRAGGHTQAPKLYGKKWLPSGEMPPYQINPSKLDPLPKQGLHRPRDIQIYRGPLVVATRGLGKRLFCAAFSGSDVVYTSLYFGISIPRQQVQAAHYLNGILNSSLAVYFLFLSASVWGVERDEIQPIDLLRLPIPLQKDNEAEVTRIVNIEERLRRNPSNEQTSLQQDLDEAVFDLYELDLPERALVQDMINFTVDLRVKRGKSAALLYPSHSDLRAYAESLIGIIQPFLRTLNERDMVANVFDVGKAPLQVVRFSMLPAPGREPAVQTTQAGNLDAILRKIAGQLPAQIADRVYTRRTLRIYTGNDLYVVKPAQLRYWSRSAGLNDADAIIAEHLEAARDSA